MMTWEVHKTSSATFQRIMCQETALWERSRPLFGGYHVCTEAAVTEIWRTDVHVLNNEPELLPQEK